MKPGHLRESVCVSYAKGVQLLNERLRDGARIKSIPLLPHTNHHYIIPLFSFPFYQVNVHDGCVCNEYRSLVRRHLVHKDVDFKYDFWRSISLETEQFYTEKLVPYTYSEVLDTIRPKKRKRYIAALEKIRTFGLWSSAPVKMFVKPDRYPMDCIYDKAPRAIQYRSPEFNLSFMRFTKPIEEWAYPNLTYGVRSGTRVIMKGLNNVDRAAILLDKISYFKRPRFIMIDHSAYDSLISARHIKLLLRKYQRLVGKGVRWCVHKQIKNKCTSKHGIRYEVEGTRMSGDADTGLGACLINCDIIYAVLKASGIFKYDFILDGDDAVIVVEQGSNIDIDVFEHCGFKTKISYTSEVERIDFCQCRIVNVDGVHKFVRNPIRAFSHYSITRNVLPIDRLGELTAGIAMCENAIHGDVPIFNAYVRGFIAEKYYLTEDLYRRMEGYELTTKIKEVSLFTRVNFAKTWNIPICDQLLIESQIISESVNNNFENVESLSRTWERWQLCHESSSGGWWDCSECST